MNKEARLLTRREFGGALLAAVAVPLFGQAAIPGETTATHAEVQEAPAAPQARALEQERREAAENLEKALKPIREFAVPTEAEPAFIFRARR